MILEVQKQVKVVSVGIVLFVAVPPLVLGLMETRAHTAAGLLIMGVIMLGLMGPYFAWTTFLTKVEIEGDTLTVTTPYSKRSFRFPEDIKQVIDDRRRDEQEDLNLHFQKGKDRFVFIVNRYVMDAPGNRLASLINDLRAQVQKSKAGEAAANPKPRQN